MTSTARRSRTRSTSRASARGRSRPRSGRRLAEEKLDPGAFDYIAGGAGGEATMRANREAFERRRHPAADAHRQHRARPRRRGPRHDVRRRRSCSRPSACSRSRTPEGEVARRAARPRLGIPFILSSAASHVDRGDRRGDGRRAALVPALLDQRPRDRRELRLARRGGRLRGDRRHARHADPRLAAPRPAQARTSRSSRGEGCAQFFTDPVFRAKLDKPPEEDMLTAAAMMLATFPNLRLDVGRPRLAARADVAADARQGRADGRGRAARARRRRRRA